MYVFIIEVVRIHICTFVNWANRFIYLVSWRVVESSEWFELILLFSVFFHISVFFGV